MPKKRGLGRGLDALLSAGLNLGEGGEITADGELRDIPIDLLQRGRYQPRMDMREEALAELARSIKAQGVVQPIVARPLTDSAGDNKGDGPNTRYEIIAGERRWRAAQMAGLRDIPAVVRKLPDEAAVVMALIENIQREDLNPLEEAAALKKLIDEFDMTHQQAGDAIGHSRAAVTNLLRLLELSGAVKPLLERGELDMGHARALLPLPPPQQLRAARIIAEKGYSTRQAEELCRGLQNTAQNGKKKTAADNKDANVRQLEADLATRLAAKVSISANSRGQGRLQVSFNSLDELDGILGRIK